MFKRERVYSSGHVSILEKLVEQEINEPGFFCVVFVVVFLMYCVCVFILFFGV